MSTSNNLLYATLMKGNVPYERQDCLGAVGGWWGATAGWAYGGLQTPFNLWSELLVAFMDDSLQLSSIY